MHDADEAAASPAGEADGQPRERFFNDNQLPQTFGCLNVCSYTHIGARGNQEDRFVYCPDLCNGEYAWFGVFDGTVKEHASEWVHRQILPIFLETPSFRAYHALTHEEKADPANRFLMEDALRECYKETDARLLDWCREREIHYSACTGVTVVVHLPTAVMYVAHVGDSHAVLGTLPPTPEGEVLQPGQMPTLAGVKLTREHKPDHPSELKRIQAAGGSLIYLKSDRPFIRGGDFKQRQHAMQLNYSRAFGGKDLKMYGLTVEPDVSTVELNWGRHRVARGPGGGGSIGKEDLKIAEEGRAVMVLLGSDGIWDVVSPNRAVNLAAVVQAQYVAEMKARARRKESAANQPRLFTCAERLVQLALTNHEKNGSNDNVTVIVAFFLDND